MGLIICPRSLTGRPTAEPAPGGKVSVGWGLGGDDDDVTSSMNTIDTLTPGASITSDYRVTAILALFIALGWGGGWKGVSGFSLPKAKSQRCSNKPEL